MLIYYSVLYLAPALLTTGIPILITWKKGEWWLLDFLVIPLPGAVWMLLLEEGARPKSFSNLAELLGLAVAVGVLFALRGWLGTRIPRALSSVLLMAVGLAVAVGLFFLVPVIPD